MCAGTPGHQLFSARCTRRNAEQAVEFRHGETAPLQRYLTNAAGCASGA